MSKKIPALLSFFCVLALTTDLLAYAVARVADLKGDVWIAQAGQGRKNGVLGQELFLKDTIETGDNGAVKILFVDDTLLTLKENSKTLISQFLYNPAKGERQTVLDVSRGKIRTLVGKFFGEDQAVEIKTPTAVAGIRGTDVGAVVEPRKTQFYCFDGKIDTFNIDNPSSVVTLIQGTAIEILEGRAAIEEHRTLIPPSVDQGSFDLSLVAPKPKEEEKKAEKGETKVTADADKDKAAKSDKTSDSRTASTDAGTKSGGPGKSEGSGYTGSGIYRDSGGPTTAAGSMAATLTDSFSSISEEGGISSGETIMSSNDSGANAFSAAAEANESTSYFSPTSATAESGDLKSQIPGGSVEVTSVDSSGAQTVSITITFP